MKNDIRFLRLRCCRIEHRNTGDIFKITRVPREDSEGNKGWNWVCNAFAIFASFCLIFCYVRFTRTPKAFGVEVNHSVPGL